MAIRFGYISILLAVLFFTVVSSLIPPFQSPDEFDHIKRAYLLSRGTILLTRGAGGSSGGMIDSGLLKYMDSYLSLPGAPNIKLSTAERLDAENIKWADVQNYSAASGTAYYFPLVYAPQALGLFIGKYFSSRVVNSYKLARFFTSLFVVLVLALAFRIYSVNPLVVLILVIPMTVFQISSASIDGISTALAILAISLFMRISVDTNNNQPWAFAALMLTVFVLVSCRIHLLPLLLVTLVASLIDGRRRSIYLWLLTGFAIAAWTMFVLKNAVDTRVVIGAPVSDVVVFYLLNPDVFFKILSNTITSDNRLDFYRDSFFGILGWLDTSLGSNIYALLVYLTLLVGALSISVRNLRRDWLPRSILLIAAFISVLLVFFALLVTWNSHPASKIEGVQGRYFLVPLVMVAYAISGETQLSNDLRKNFAYFLVFIVSIVTAIYMPIALLDRYFVSPIQDVYISPHQRASISPLLANITVVNDLVKSDDGIFYRRSGNDPYFLISVSRHLETKNTRYITFRLNCNGMNEPVHLQFFWSEINGLFSENDSLKFVVHPGVSTIDLLPHSKWRKSDNLAFFRIDLDSPSSCPKIVIDKIEFSRSAWN